ncbi:MAG: hypothetical protein JWM21_3847 [Acidobacteria bacterium]|nr:hypothetical protein [Acidobacteriota bacterium]
MCLRTGIIICLLLTAATAARAATCTEVNARPDAWVTGRVDALILAARRAFEDEKAEPAYEKVLSGIATTIRQCKVDEDVVFVSRYPQFVQYVATLSLGSRPDHELGFEVPDKQYFTETAQFVQVPDFLLDQGFLRSVSRYETLPRAKAFLRQLNLSRKPGEQLIFFSYESRHLGTPDNDNSFRRLLIVVPGDAEKDLPDKWVQFGVTDPGMRARVRNVSVVTAVPGPEGTSNVYFKDFFRTYRRDGLITLKGRWELGFGDDKCVQCHKSGILPIFPENGSVAVEERPALLAVNERFLTYGSARFDKYLDERKYGPGLSSASEADRNRRFGAGFEKTVAGRAMTCSGCHHYNRLGTFNWPMDQVLLSSFIKGGKMPYGLKLQPAERNEVYDKLIQEYFAVSASNPGILKSWLLAQQR